ncbi:uncharacterized protein LOC143617312 [Bidens hawaiensis]|uniref:uncharacterized protein LOC143617312 n=1 Tax=Bidens hawaiensis TaxID=980011 RepID=UPI004049F3CF
MVELGHVSLTDSQDRWIWSFGDMTDFTVKGVRKVIDEFILPSWARKTIWFKFLPRKVNICAWRVLLKRLPMRVNLVSKGIDIPSSLCPICNDHEESIDHVFGMCSVANRIWGLVASWLGLPLSSSLAPIELMSWWDTLRVQTHKKDMIGMIIFVNWWIIWRFRNDLVFEKNRHNKETIFDEILNFSFLWYSSKNRKCNISSIEWLKNPLLYL